MLVFVCLWEGGETLAPVFSSIITSTGISSQKTKKNGITRLSTNTAGAVAMLEPGVEDTS